MYQNMSLQLPRAYHLNELLMANIALSTCGVQPAVDKVLVVNILHVSNIVTVMLNIVVADIVAVISWVVNVVVVNVVASNTVVVNSVMVNNLVINAEVTNICGGKRFGKIR